MGICPLSELGWTHCRCRRSRAYWGAIGVHVLIRRVPVGSQQNFILVKRKPAKGKASAGSLGDPMFSSSRSIGEMPREEGERRLV